MLKEELGKATLLAKLIVEMKVEIKKMKKEG